MLKEFSAKVDMIFADPPYFLSKGFTWRENGKVKCFDKGEWDRHRSVEEVDAFNMQWLGLCRKILMMVGVYGSPGLTTIYPRLNDV